MFLFVLTVCAVSFSKLNKKISELPNSEKKNFPANCGSFGGSIVEEKHYFILCLT